MKTLLRDPRVRRLLLANITGSVGSGVTLIAVPWLLIQQPGGEALYGWATLGTTIAFFLAMPYYGAWLDRHSRKTMLLAGELFGFGATSALAAAVFLSGEPTTWELIAIYFCGMLYFTLHYPAKNAFLQQIFSRDQYQSLMGLLEIQGQTAMMIAGGLATVLIERVPLTAILVFDAATYLFSFLVQARLPYRATHLEGIAPTVIPGIWHASLEGWRWLRERPRLSVFFACTLVPYILVMVSNYLFPIYVADVLHAPAAVFGRGEIIFAVGAILAGAFVPRLATHRGADQAIVFTNVLCLASLVLLGLAPSHTAFYAALLLFGFGNAGNRVARSTLLFSIVPNALMGRVGMFYGLYDRVVRTVLTFAMTMIVVRGSAIWGFAVLGAVMAAAFVGALLTRRAAVPPPAVLAAAPG